MFTTPILLIIFNREDKAKRLIDSLRIIKPTNIFISADGPRDTVKTDAERCEKTRIQVSSIDWPCNVHTNFHPKNTGSDFGPEKAINWFFEQVDEGIVLEDDCIPHPDFFNFAELMLKKYRNYEQVMMISGDNFQNGIRRGEASYYFSKYPSTWGWASWKRAWKYYDTKTSYYNDFIKTKKIDTICQNKIEKKFWLKFFNQIHSGKLEHWDIKWLFAIWNNDGISITPNVNLVQNIGFGKDATHTFNENEKTMVVMASELGDLIIHPDNIHINKDADVYLFKHVYEFTLSKKISYLKEIITKKFSK